MVCVLLPAVMAPVGFLSCEVNTWRTCCILGAENHDAATVLAAKWNTRALVSGLDYQPAWEAVDLWSGKVLRDCELSLIFWFIPIMMNFQSSAANQQPVPVNQTPPGRRSRVNVKKSVRPRERKSDVMVTDGRRRQKKLSCWLFFWVVCPLQ